MVSRYAMPGLTNDAGLDILEVTQLSMLDKGMFFLNLDISTLRTKQYSFRYINLLQD